MLSEPSNVEVIGCLHSHAHLSSLFDYAEAFAGGTRTPAHASVRERPPWLERIAWQLPRLS